MTQAELEQLSRDVAEKYRVEPFYEITNEYKHNDSELVWLHDDSARCFDLMVEHNLMPNVYSDGDDYFYSVSGYPVVQSKDHNYDKPLTARIAGLKALLAKDKS